MDPSRPLPARMINEFVYCPRLFYLQWVDGRFEDSDDVVLGRQLHRRVDTETGAAPLPDDGPLREATSVLLGSTELGVVARIDVLSGDGDTVVPIDVKKGAPQSDGTPWPSDAVQVLLQAILLREHGYRCDRAEVYYATPRRRVPVELTAEQLAWAEGLVAEARRTADRAVAPLPLVDSPKCARCALVGVCLPDETNALLDRIDHQPRRILPPDPDTGPVYVTEPGSYVGLRRGRVEITGTRGGERVPLGSFRLIDVAQLVVFGRVQVSTSVLHELFDRRVPVLWLTYGGWLKGWASGAPAKYVELRRRQTVAHSHGGLGLANRMVEGKIRNCRTMLRRNARGDVSTTVNALARLAGQARDVDSFSSLLGVEGAAARLYFGALPSLIAEPRFADVFAADGRNRRPPRDPVNALLSFCYAMLTKDLVATVLGVGFDPYLGIYHRSRYGRPALALDLAEEFRPLIADSVVLAVLNKGQVGPNDFITRAGGVALTADARRTVLAAYERRLATTVTHPVFGYRISYRRVLDVQARLLASVLVGEAPEYQPMVTR